MLWNSALFGGVMYDTSELYEIRYNQHLVVIVYQH